MINCRPGRLINLQQSGVQVPVILPNEICEGYSTCTFTIDLNYSMLQSGTAVNARLLYHFPTDRFVNKCTVLDINFALFLLFSFFWHISNTFLVILEHTFQQPHTRLCKLFKGYRAALKMGIYSTKRSRVALTLPWWCPRITFKVLLSAYLE